MSLLPRMQIWVKERVALAATILLLAFIGFALHFDTISIGWILVYDVFRAYLWWPLAILITGLIMLLIGLLCYKKLGLPQFFPWSVVTTAGLLLILTIFSLSKIAADWSVLWSLAAVILLGIGAWSFAVGFVTYAELWRLFANQEVVQRVEQALIDDSFRSKLTDQDWGSKHCLKIIQEYYIRRKREAFEKVEDVKKLEACLKAGDDVLYYLSCRWPDQTFPSSELTQSKANLLRELITLCLATRLRENNKWISRIEPWLKEWSELYDQQDTYRQLLAQIFALGREKQPNSDPNHIAKIVSEFWESFQLLTRQVTKGSQQNDLTIIATTWLSVAHYGIPGQVCFDVWMALQELQNKDLFVPIYSDEYDPAISTARYYLADWYGTWQKTIQPDWDRGLNGKASYARQLLSTGER